MLPLGCHYLHHLKTTQICKPPMLSLHASGQRNAGKLWALVNTHDCAGEASNRIWGPMSIEAMPYCPAFLHLPGSAGIEDR